MYIETSAPRKQGDKARLVSKTYPTSDNMCLGFWYHMYGPNIGTLNVYASSASTGLGTPVWTLYGDQGNTWNKAQVTVQTTTPYQVPDKTMGLSVIVLLKRLTAFKRLHSIYIDFSN